jgi:hypothetical protein
MPKSRNKEKEKEKEEKNREPKKSRRALVNRVKKVLRKSRRKLGDERFEKELQRTITFLARLQTKLGHTNEEKKAPPKSAKKPRKKAAKVTAKTGARASLKAGPKAATAKRPAAKRPRKARAITTQKK